MKNRFFITFIIFFLFSRIVYPQTAEQFNQLSKDYFKRSLDSADYFAAKALQLAQTNKDQIQMGFALKNQGSILYYRGKKEAAIVKYKQAVNSFNSNLQFDESSDLYHNLGVLYYKMGYTDESIKFYHLSIETRKKTKNKDGYEGTYNGLAVLYQDISLFDSASFYLNLALKNTSKYDTTQLANLYNSIGRNFIYQGQHDSALHYYTKSFELKKNQNDSMSLAVTIENIGMAFSSKTNYDTAISCYNLALDIYNKFDNPSAKARIYNNIGNLYFKLKDSLKSENYYLKSLKIYKQTNNNFGESGIYNNLGLVQLESKSYAHAKQYFLKAVALLRAENRPKELALTFQNLAVVSKALEAFNDAIYYIEKSNDLAKTNQLVNIFYQNNYTLAEIYSALNQNEKAFKILNAIDKESAKQYMSTDDYLSSLILLSTLFAEQGRYKDAYQTLLQYNQYFKSQMNERLFKEVTTISTKYETERIAKENEIYKKQAKIEKLKSEQQHQEIKSNRIVIGATFIVLLASLLVLFFLYKTNRNRRKFTKALIEKNVIISEQNFEIEQQLDLLEAQKSIVETQKEEITDSINYAKRFQTAIIPNQDFLHSVFPQSFVLYKPRDIVSGDFYYVAKKGSYKYFVAADCTGHGVPGAFLSIIGNNGLSGALNRFELTHLGEIIQFLNQYLFDILHQNQDMHIQDGIDLTIVRVDEDHKTITYTGANNPLVLIRKKELTAFKTHKYAVGVSKENTFDIHTLNYEKGDSIFLFSDGYADQFGGEKGKKFMRKNFYHLLSEISHLEPKAQKEKLDAELHNWMLNEEQVDDILVAGIRL